MTNRSDGTPAGVLEIHNPLLMDLGLLPTRAPRARYERSPARGGPGVEPTFGRAQTLLTLGAGALAMLLLWAPIVLGLPVAHRELLGGVLFGVLVAVFAVLYGLLRLVSAARAMPAGDDHGDADLPRRHEHGRWRLRLLAALGSVGHAVIYVLAIQ
jgi:hypothetical protein